MVTSVNGPESTHIVGQGPPGSNAVRCGYLAGGARVSGFTLRDGASKSFQGLTGPGCIIQRDPKFVNYAAGDYRLRADSPSRIHPIHSV